MRVGFYRHDDTHRPSRQYDVNKTYYQNTPKPNILPPILPSFPILLTLDSCLIATDLISSRRALYFVIPHPLGHYRQIGAASIGSASILHKTVLRSLECQRVSKLSTVGSIIVKIVARMVIKVHELVADACLLIIGYFKV